MSTFGRIISIVLAIILILFIPIQYIAQSQVETMDHIVEAHTHEFTDSVRQKGSITLEDYEEYLSKIDQTKELYNIEIEHATPKTLSDLTLNIQEDTRLVSNGLTIVPDTSKIDSIDAELQSLAAHTHTAACYNGNLHICNGTDCEYDNSSTEILLNTTVKTRSANETKYTQYLIPSKDGGQTWGEHMELGARYGFYPYKYKQEFTYGPDGCYYYLRGDAAASLYKYNPITKISTLVYSFPSNSYPEKIMYRNNLFFVVEHNTKTYSTSYIYTSANGSTWTKGSGFHTQCYIDNIAYGNGIYVAAGYKFNPSPNTINRATVFTSTDGITWTHRIDRGFNGEDSSGSVIFAGDRFILGTSSDYLLSSYDGINWSYMNRPSLGAKSTMNLAYGNNTLVIADTTNSCIYTTTNYGATYSSISIPFGSKVIEYYNGYFYLGEEKSSISTNSGFEKSADGITWTKLSYPEPPGWNNYYSESVYNISFNSIRDIEHSATCIKKGKYYDNNGYEVQPECNQVVMQIRAKYPYQTVDKGKAINTIAIASYLDGHEGEVSCSSNYNPNIGGLQTVTLTYSGKVDNARTNGTKTTTINVTVIDKKVSSIVVTPYTQIIERYQKPSFIVRVYYDDGTSNITSAYKITGFNNKNLGKQIVSFSYTENDIEKYTTATVIVTNLTKVCPICSTRYELDNNDIDNGCPNCASTITGIDATPDLVKVSQGSALPITVYALYKNGGSSIINNWTSNYEPLKIGYQEVTINYKEFKDYITVEVKASKNICSICGKEYHLNEDGSDPGCPICSTTIIGIKAEPNPIIIELHQPLNIRVTATFKDGHTELVNGWTSDMVPDKPGTYNVTIFYKSATVQITVTILDYDLIECTYCGTIFSRSKNPSGCSVCSAELIGIEASLRNGGTTVIKGSKLDLEIVLIFRDTHKEITNTGYTISNYNPELLGEQTIEVHYKEYRCSLVIEAINTFGKITCPKGHVYHLNEDGRDSGCPYCIDYGDREKLVVYYDITYTANIIETLYNQNIYNMKAGDYITIIITKKNRSLGSQIINIFSNINKLNYSITYGGEVIG